MKTPTFKITFCSFALAILLCSPCAHGGLVGYWKFDENTGTAANDSSGNLNHGTLGGAVLPTWVTGRSGNAGDYALNFPAYPGTTWVKINPSTSLGTVSGQFTIAAWVKESASNYYGHLFTTKDGAGANRRWYWQNGSGGDQQNYVGSDQATGWNNYTALGATSNYTVGTWTHTALTYDASGGATRLKLWINGVNTASYNFGGTVFPSFAYALFFGGPDTNGGNFIGSMDDVIIFNSVENVATIMNGTHSAMQPAPVWSGGGTLSGGQLLWTDSANWSGAVMAGGKTLTFATAAAPGSTTNSNNFANNTAFTGITYNSGTGAFTLNGNSINLTGDVVNNSSNVQTIGNSLVLDGGNRTFNAASGSITVNNGIGDAQAGRGLTKSGANTLTLGGTSNYTGATAVNAGPLMLNGATLGNTTTTISGATATLAGNGSVAGTVTVQSSGRLAPGINASTIGTLALNGGLTLNTANLDVKGAAPGSSDLVSVTGNLVLTGNTQVNLTQQLSGFGIGDYTILTYTGTLTGNTSQLLAPPQDANFSYSILTVGNQIKLHVTAASSKTYYVSQSVGNDSNDGLSSVNPWKTLTKASSVTLNPGDSVLLKSGDTWTDGLQPKGNGTAANPIFIGSYGSGNKPIIDRNDAVQQNGIHLINQEGYKIVGLEFYRCETGIFGEYHTGMPVRSYVWIEDCYFHDSLRYGTYYDYYNAKNISLGICFWTFLSYSNNISLQDITVKNCVFRRMSSGIWTNSPDNFDYFADNYYNFANLNVIGCLFEEGKQWQLGLRGVIGGQITNCVTHDTGRINNFVAFNGVAGAMMYRLKNFTFTDSEWGFVSRGGGSGDGEAFDLEGNNTNMTFTRCLFHDTDGPCFMLFKGSNANPSNTGNLFTDCVWNGKAANSNLGRQEIYNASPGSAQATFTSSRFYLAAGVNRSNNDTGFTYSNCMTRNLSDAGTGTNLSLATTASSSSQQVGFEASKGRDGNVATIWRPTTAANEWLQIDFAVPTLVNEFRLREEAGSTINRYVIQYWDSTTSTWLGCFNGRTMGTNFIAPIVGRTTTKLRLAVTSTTSGTPGIAEFEAYYVAIPPPPSNAFWRIGDGVWDINTTNNWKTSGGNPVNYIDGDIVFLDDTATGTSPITITLNSTVAPTSMTVNGAKNYTLTGGGGIGGSGTLTKNNGGKLTLSSANTFSGTKTLNGGMLSFGAASNLPAGNITFNGGTLEFTGATSVGTYTLTGGSASVLLDVTQASGVVTAIRPNGNYSGLTKSGPGQLTLANAGGNDSGDLLVNGGTVLLQGTTNVGGGVANTAHIQGVVPGAVVRLANSNGGQAYFTFTMSGGTLDANGQTPNTTYGLPTVGGSGVITNSSAVASKLAFSNRENKTFSGSIQDGTGKLGLHLGGVLPYVSGTGTWTLSGINTYSGDTTVNYGTLALADNAGLKFVITNSSNNAINGSSTVNLAGDFTIDTSAVSASTGTWTLVNAATLNETFTSSFTVVGFTPNVNGISWTKVNGTKTWTFTENDGKLVLSVSPATPFSTWANAKSLVSPDADPDDDPDKDGNNNLAEFAFNGNPLSATDNGFQRLATEDTPADGDALKELTLTLAVRNSSGAPVFSGSPSLTATVDGIVYTVEGSLDLNFPGSVVSETTAQGGLPALPGGYEYRRFRLNASNGLPGKGFLRARVSIP